MKKKRPERFRLSTKEQNGLTVLTVLVALLFIAWQLFRQLPPQVDDADSRAFQAAWEAFKTAQAEQAETKGSSDSSAASPVVLREFDPNLADKSTLLSLGLPERTVRILLNYRNRGGRFRSKADLKKIYTLSEADYKRLAPYVRIRTPSPEQQASPAGLRKTAEEQPPAVLELNTVTAPALARLPGMDYQLAKRLLEFRHYLGGFHSVRQIRELYGFPDTLFPAVEKRLKVSTVHLRRIDLNQASVSELEDHPYITRKMAEQISGLTNSLGRIDSVEQIKQLTLINAEIYRKIAPYLKTD